MTPQRIQRKRTRGWKMPENTVYVGRPSKWGNPFKVGDTLNGIILKTNSMVVEAFRRYTNDNPKLVLEAQSELIGKNLACWCEPDEECHADVWLRLVN